MEIKKVAFVGILLLLLFALVFGTTMTAATVVMTDLYGASATVESGKSVAYYLQFLNARIVTGDAQVPGQIIDPITSPTTKPTPAPVTPAPVVPAPVVNSGVGDLSSFTFAPANPADVSYPVQKDAQVGMAFFIIKDSDLTQYKFNKVGQDNNFPILKVGTNLYRLIIADSSAQYVAVPRTSSSTLLEVKPFVVITSSSTDNVWNAGDKVAIGYYYQNIKSISNLTIKSTSKYFEDTAPNTEYSLNSSAVIPFGAIGGKAIKVNYELDADSANEFILNSIELVK